MYKTERQRELMNILKEEKNGGFVSIHRLARQMFASEATIRRDLRELEAQNAIKRAYGGVALMEYLNQNIPLPLREQTHHPEKVEAARRAASVVRDGDVLFLDGASTTLEMIPFLAERKDLTVITNAASAADRLGELGIRTYCTGGLLTPSSQAYTGRFAEEMIRSFHADAMFFSSAGISPEGEITDYSDEETSLRRPAGIFCSTRANSARYSVIPCAPSRSSAAFFPTAQSRRSGTAFSTHNNRQKDNKKAAESASGEARARPGPRFFASEAAFAKLTILVTCFQIMGFDS